MDVVSLEHRSVAQISMNVVNEFVTAVPFVRILPDHTNVFVLNKQLVIHTQHLAAYFQINVLEMKTVLRIWLASKGNAQSHATLQNVEGMQFVNQANTKHSASARVDI